MLIRNLDENDKDDIFKWRNDKISRSMFFESSVVSKESHDKWFFKCYSSNIRLIIVGAVHIAEPLVNIAETIGYKTIVIDPRDNFDEKRFKNVQKILRKWPDEGLKEIEIDNKCAVVTLTHDPKLDDPALNYALHSNAFYIGCLGSKKTHESRIKRLKKRKFSDKDLTRLNGPIGLDIKAKTPAEIACSIIAEIINLKNSCYDF